MVLTVEASRCKVSVELIARHQLGLKQREMIMARNAMIARVMVRVERVFSSVGETVVLQSRLGVLTKALFFLFGECFLQDELLSIEVLLLFDVFHSLGGLHLGGVLRGGLHLVLVVECR